MHQLGTLVFRFKVLLSTGQLPKLGKDCRVSASACFEGEIKSISIGSGAVIGKDALITCGKGAQITIGNNCKIQKDAEILAEENSNIQISDNCLIGKNTQIIAGANGIIRLGNKCVMPNGVLINSGHDGKIILDDYVSINAYSNIAGHGGLHIGEYTRIGAMVVIYAQNHIFADKTKVIKHQGLSRKGITIGKDVWIGGGATILDGVKIADGSVVGAGSVVTKEIEEYTVVAGVPAKKIKNRG